MATTTNIKTYTADSSIGKRLAEVQRLSLEIDRLQEQLDDHKAFLLAHAKRNGFEKLIHGPVSASVRGRQSWTYSPGLQAVAARLKDRQKQEQKEGVATASTTEHLVVAFSARISLAKA
jgi:hypothetical protein